MSQAERAADAAAAWIIRRENHAWSEEDQAALDGWLKESDGNKAAYWRLRHSWREADRIGSLGVRPAERSWGNRLWRPTALVASLALVIGLGTAQWDRLMPRRDATLTRYDTTIGGHRLLSLSDGSHIELNTKTAVRTAVSSDRREVWLDEGEAFFEVAHDATHPFVVHAGPKTVMVLGTKFSVRREAGKVTVAVLQGRVRVDDARGPAMARTNSATITSGTIAISEGPATLVTQRSEQKVEDGLAWRDGMLTFDQMPLSHAAAEFNRYNDVPLVVTDSRAAGIRIGGSFRASNVEAFTRLLHDAYGLTVTRDQATVKISS